MGSPAYWNARKPDSSDRLAREVTDVQLPEFHFVVG